VGTASGAILTMRAMATGTRRGSLLRMQAGDPSTRALSTTLARKPRPATASNGEPPLRDGALPAPAALPPVEDSDGRLRSLYRGMLGMVAAAGLEGEVDLGSFEAWAQRNTRAQGDRGPTDGVLAC